MGTFEDTIHICPSMEFIIFNKMILYINDNEKYDIIDICRQDITKISPVLPMFQSYEILIKNRDNVYLLGSTLCNILQKSIILQYGNMNKITFNNRNYLKINEFKIFSEIDPETLNKEYCITNNSPIMRKKPKRN